MNLLFNFWILVSESQIELLDFSDTFSADQILQLKVCCSIFTIQCQKFCNMLRPEPDLFSTETITIVSNQQFLKKWEPSLQANICKSGIDLSFVDEMNYEFLHSESR